MLNIYQLTLVLTKSLHEVLRKSINDTIGQTKKHCSCKKNPEFVKVSLISQEMIFTLPIEICSVLRAKIGRRNKVTSSKAHLSFAKGKKCNTTITLLLKMWFSCNYVVQSFTY